MILRLWNSYKFYEMYASEKVSSFKFQVPSNNILDKWIITRLEKLKQEVSNSLENYELDKAVRPLGGFIDDFSTWYIRRSRERFKSESNDKFAAIETTKYVLSEFSKILAPFAPFVAEVVYKMTSDNKKIISVHLEKWPVFDKKLIDKNLLDSMAEARRVASLALELRGKEGIKVRQPLSELRIKNSELRDKKELLGILADEINVKKIIFDSKISGEIVLDTKITPELK